jgi:hypothetical protein
VQCDLVAVLEQQVDLRRVFLDDPGGDEKGQVQIATCKLSTTHGIAIKGS